jgi:hypothetical protein
MPTSEELELTQQIEWQIFACIQEVLQEDDLLKRLRFTLDINAVWQK